MSEMAQTADHLVIIGRGRLLADLPTAELIESSARRDVLLRSPRAAALAALGILALLPAPWNGRLGRFTLLQAARQVSALHPAANLFSPGWSLLVLLAWPAAAPGAAAVLITRRDA